MKKNILRIFLAVVILMHGVAAVALTAGFTADVTSGCAPLVVHFTNTSTGASSYSWNLGNGTTSALTNTAGSYLTPGVYTITLVATAGTNTATATMTVTVYPAPSVSFYANDTAACPGSPVTFTSTTTPGVPGAISYIWNFGDGVTSSISPATHTFPGPGYYNITLFATNSEGCQASLMEPAYIHIYTPPSGTFSAATTYFCSPPGDASFTSAPVGTGPFTYAWAFGDGNTSTAADPSENYATTGTYPVTLVVTDGHGCKDTITHPGYIVVTTLTAGFSSVPTACVNSSVMFHNTSGPFSTCYWNFGDGWTSTLDSAAHVFTVPGTYTVTMVISSGPCHDTVTHSITITPGPTMAISASPAHPCPAPTPVTYSGVGVPAGSTVNWFYGDAATGTGTPATHTYLSDGCFYVDMVVTQPNGCKDTVQMIDTIAPITPILVDSPNSGCVPLTVYFGLSLLTQFCDTFTVPYPLPLTTYNWVFGDGSSSAAASPTSHTYTAVGVYNGTINATTSNGCHVSDSFVVAVGTPPSATFVGAPTHICADRSVFFTSTTTGAVTSWHWDFGDGSTAIDTVPGTSHDYTTPGTFTVTLIVYDNGCPGVPYTLTDYITVDSPKAIMSDSFVCVPPTMIGFDNLSLGATSWTWSFGDGSTSTLLNPVHNYSALGTYDVQLYTYNFRSGCHDTANMLVDLFKPVMTFSTPDTAVCQYSSLVLTPTVTGGTATSYTWYVDGIYKPDTSTPPLRDTFYVPGLYTVELIITDQHGCRDTLIKNNYIIAGKPVDSFVAAPPFGCWPLDVTFTDHSTDVPGAFPVAYSWTFGDGTTGTGSPVAHTYTTAGTFGVVEIVTDNIGCKDTITKPALISVTRPHAAFTVNKTAPCIGDSINFTNLSTGIVSSLWIFGDGGTASTFNAPHAYMAVGSYTVMLVVTDINGCTDTAKYTNYINVTQPNASFYNTDSFTICLPLSSHFINTSTGAVGYHWSFGNGDSSIVISPSELYVLSGLDTVILVATNAFGCKDTAIGHVNLYGYAGGFSYTPDTGCSPLTVFFNAGLVNVPSVIWDFADGTVSGVSSLDTITHIYSVPGKYLPKLILSDNTGCQNSSTGLDTIKVDAAYAGFKIQPYPVCVNEPITLTDTSHSYFSTITGWNWSFCDTCHVITATGTDTYTFDTVGYHTISLTVTDGWGCTSSIAQSADVLPPPNIGVGGDTVICVGDKATLTAYGGVSYSWSPGATLSCTLCNPTQASPTVVTQYTVTGTDANGCVGKDTVSVYLKTKTVSSASGGGEACQGTPLQLFDSGATKFTWIPSTGLNNATIADPIATPGTSETYEVIAQLASCIPDTNYVTVTVYPLPTIHANGNQVIVDGSSANITSTGTNVATIGWYPSGTLSCDSCYNPVATPPGTTVYKVVVHSPFGCEASDSVLIKVVCDASQVFIPNSFTPNGDGNNDVFYPRGTGISQVKSFRIYNRWGELLFEKDNFELNDVNSAWNGSYMGGTPRPDVYVYIVDATCNNGEPLSIKGDVTIIR